MPSDYAIELVTLKVVPADRPWDKSMTLTAGSVGPFVVEASWSGPAGVYRVQWSLRTPSGVIVYQGSESEIFVRGMQSLSTYSETVTDRIEIAPGAYLVAFTAEGRFAGSIELEVLPESDEAA